MFLKYLSLIVSILCAEIPEYVQTLVFGRDDAGQHYCNVSLSPRAPIIEATIFRVIDIEENSAVAFSTHNTEPVPNSDFYKIEIPEELISDSIEYSFEFNIPNGKIFSQPWAFDREKNRFALASSIDRKFWQNRTFQISAAMGGLIASGLCGNIIYRKMKKSRDVL